jgi:hypothetical protein
MDISPQQPFQPFRRQHDVAGADAGADNPLPTYCRYRDLMTAGIVTNRMQLARLIAKEGFPRGFRLSANTHVWDVSTVRRWLASKQQAAA